MFKRLSQSLIEKSVSRAYSKRIETKGDCPEGVFWTSELTQIARFDYALMQLRQHLGQGAFSIADIGCGYGALYDFISTTPRYSNIRYSGMDINKQMISHCQDRFPTARHLFSSARHPQTPVHAAIYIGTFNLCHTDDYSLWEDYILDQISLSWGYVTEAIMLNMTSLNAPQIRNHIFYAEPGQMKDRLEARFGPTTASPTRFLTDDTTFIVMKQ